MFPFLNFYKVNVKNASMFSFLGFYKNFVKNYALILFFILIVIVPVLPARILHDRSTELINTAQDTNNNNNTEQWHSFLRFLDADKGSQVAGMSELKNYFQRFGYLSNAKTNLTDLFDEEFESAVFTYQQNLGLPSTGKLDNETMEVIMSPRCGVSDENSIVHHHHHKLHATVHFAYFDGEPIWHGPIPINLTYAYTSLAMINYLSESDIKSAFERSFARWSSVVPVNFEETQNNHLADIKIGFYSGDHGDGHPFDGILGVLGHAFAPENGNLHLDGDERWAVNDFTNEKSKMAIDLESVVTHEIGHVLGMAHSTVKEAIMYPSISTRKTKVDLNIDDIEGIHQLYGSTRNFKYHSFHGFSISSSWRRSLSLRWTWTTLLAMVIFMFVL